MEEMFRESRFVRLPIQDGTWPLNWLDPRFRYLIDVARLVAISDGRVPVNLFPVKSREEV